MTPLATRIRQIRARVAKNQTEFAHILGCGQNSVSRYEAGDVVPRPAVLLRLYDLALDDEKQLIAEHLKLALGTYILGSEATVDADIEEIRPLFAGGEDLAQILFNRRNVGFGSVVFSIARGSGRIDESLIEILELWHRHGADPKSKQYFRDAAGFLRVQLARLSSGKRPSKRHQGSVLS
jgi:transcriptional regulator with XRE-family HTH domain